MLFVVGVVGGVGDVLLVLVVSVLVLLVVVLSFVVRSCHGQGRFRCRRSRRGGHIFSPHTAETRGAQECQRDGEQSERVSRGANVIRIITHNGPRNQGPPYVQTPYSVTVTTACSPTILLRGA